VALKVLISGGAGFLGTHLARELLRRGCDVTILDNFSPQIHGTQKTLPYDLAGTVRLVHGDVRDPAAWESTLPGQNCIVHLAAETGTGRSMYDIAHYNQVNIGGTALLYELLTQRKGMQVERIVVASSRAVYGEGAYQCDVHGMVFPAAQTTEAKQAGRFDPACPFCGKSSATVATPESAPMQPTSFYGLTKQTQEQMALLFGGALGIATIALRYQNIMGPGQSLHNPYTGILTIFSNQARHGEVIQVFEDGRESRDFVFVDDAVRASADAVTSTLPSLATAVNAFYGGASELRVSGAFREGDIRHALADLTLAQMLLAYVPQTKFADGLSSFLQWATESNQKNETRAYEHAIAEMRKRGLLHG